MHLMRLPALFAVYPDARIIHDPSRSGEDAAVLDQHADRGARVSAPTMIRQPWSRGPRSACNSS